MPSLPFLHVVILAFLFSLPAFLLILHHRFTWSRLEVVGLILGPAVLTALSFFLYSTRIGGTVLYTAHGWPHIYALYSIKDLLSEKAIGIWHIVPGYFFSYVLADYIFYGAALSLLVLFAKKHGGFKNKF